MQEKLRLLVILILLCCVFSRNAENAHSKIAPTGTFSNSSNHIQLPPVSKNNIPSGYEGALDDLRPVVPIWYRPLKDPIGLTLSADGTRAYVIEKGLHRLVWVDINPSSPNYASINVITDALDDPQMALSLNAAESFAYVVENAPGKLKKIRLSDGQVTTITSGLTNPIDLALSLDESMAYVTQYYEPTLVSVDLTDGTVNTVTTDLAYPTGINLSLDGSIAYVGELLLGRFHQVDLSTGTMSDASTEDVELIYDIVVDPTGTYAYLINFEPRLVRLNLNTGSIETIVHNTSERLEAIDLSPDGSTLYGVQRGVGRLIKIDLNDATPESIFPVLHEPTGLTLNHNGTNLYILEEISGELSVKNVDSASPNFGEVSTIAQSALPQEDPDAYQHHSVAVDPTETWALVPYSDGLRQIDLSSGSISTVVENTFTGAIGIALGSDGSTAYIGDQNGIWEVNTTYWTATQLAVVPYGVFALSLNPTEDTIYGLRVFYDQYDLPKLVSVRLSDGMLTEIPSNVPQPEGLAVMWDGKYAVVSDFAEGGRLWRVDLKTGESQVLVHIPNWTRQDWCQVGSVAIDSDNSIYISAADSGDQFMRNGVIYSLLPGINWRLSILYDSPLHHVEDQAISIDGNWLYAISANSLYRINLSAGADHGEITNIVDGQINSASGLVETTGDFVWAVAAHALHKISLIDGSLLKSIDYLRHSSGIGEHGLDISGDGNFAYLTTMANELLEVNLSSDEVRIITNSLSSPYDAEVNAARTYVYVAEKEMNRLVSVNISSGVITTVTTNLERPVSVALDEFNNQAIVLESPYPDHYISKVNLTTGAVSRVFNGETNYRENPRGLSLTPDHTIAYYGRSRTGEIWGVDLSSGAVADNLFEGINAPHGFALTNGGTGAITVSEFVPRVRYVDFENGIVSTKADLSGSGHGLDLTGDETTAYVTLFYDDEFIEVDLSGGTWSYITSGAMNGRVVLGPSETIAYVSGAIGTINSVDLSDGSRSALISDLYTPHSFPTLDINSSGTKLYSTVGNTGELGDYHLYSIDLPGGSSNLITTIEHAQDAPGDVTISPDEKYAYIYDQYGSYIGAGVWRVDIDPASSNYREVISMAKWIGELQHGEFSSDGRNLVMSRADLNQMLSLCLADDCIPLEADFSASPIHGIAPLKVNFNNLSRGNYTSIHWDFGDGGSSTDLNPTHTFNNPGTYTITLTIYGSEGSDMEVKEECIHVKAEVFLPLIIQSAHPGRSVE
ncbi:PKD domain-containing protein [Chloroflexota bacterium]